MPHLSDKQARLFEENDPAEGELPYISKSRVKSWLQNPEHFRFKYVERLKPAETDAMVRGSRIHEAFERFYWHARSEPTAVVERPEELLPVDRQLWADFIAPYILNFIEWERERFQEAGEFAEYLPVSIEEEYWIEPQLGLEGEPEWMGLADVILPAASIAEIDSNEGVVVVDFKTGSVPKEQYRHSPDGIHTELEYYTMLFEDKYNVVGAAAFYPKKGELLVQPDDRQYRRNVNRAVAEMVEFVVERQPDHYPRNEGPLCKWGTSDDEQSDFYGICNCTWGVPANNRNQFEYFVEQGLSADSIAEALGTTEDAVHYWKYKFDLQ